jgi:phage shock protein C
MFCTRCGIQLNDENFCPQCGQPTGRFVPARPPETNLSIPAEGRKIGGVCAGFARYIGMDVTLVRILWLVIAIFTGVGFVAYLVAWLLMPKDVAPTIVYVPQTHPPQPAQPPA